LRTWKGISVKCCGQPGKAGLVNKKYKKEEASEEAINDSEKQRLLFDLACKIKELEELKDIRTAHERFQKV
tara:strand:- start:1080 stop:1292 length:213 start_codon:yes stop_codon:yes gene_type:complete